MTRPASTPAGWLQSVSPARDSHPQREQGMGAAESPMCGDRLCSDVAEPERRDPQHEATWPASLPLREGPTSQTPLNGLPLWQSTLEAGC